MVTITKNDGSVDRLCRHFLVITNDIITIKK